MREIKFRLWDGENHKWFIKGEDGLVSNMVCCDSWDMFDPDDYVWCQYTGLKDVNGKDIYEGDIVSVDVQDYPAGYARETIFVGVIVFEESTCGFCVKLLKRPKFNGEEFPSEICGLPVSGWDDYEYDYFWFDESVNDEDIEVVGNTHENPELLEDD